MRQAQLMKLIMNLHKPGGTCFQHMPRAAPVSWRIGLIYFLAPKPGFSFIMFSFASTRY